MAIKGRIEQLERKRLKETGSSVIGEFLLKHAEPFENEEERKEILKILEKLEDPDHRDIDIPMNMYPKLMYGMLLGKELTAQDQNERINESQETDTGITP